ncbi:MAG: twin-arginine translocase subunit TatC [Candidatus Marinimicrobia bacterium]|jgi:sec-independent protein translocase protein TatC|nr:twin-arginine translocase subunit TatC [Candidatus Neomarinimicrobiota bacterium]|tara:strand:- start:195 stop:923 length:729 start_codon:yes stop_codon:yes gene_type:complete
MSSGDHPGMGFLEHLEELRWRLVRSFSAIILGSAISYGYIDEILSILLYPSTITNNPIVIQSLQVQSMFLIKWFISFASGFIMALPYLIYQFWKFVAPGLKINEKRFALPFVFFAFTSFICGVVFGYFVLVPFSLEFFSGIAAPHVENNFSIQYYFSFITWLLIGAGVIFQLPVVSLVLSTIGILTPAFMRHYRRHSIVVILILSSFITPPDPVSMLIMSFPLVLLYETSIGVSWLVNRKRT